MVHVFKKFKMIICYITILKHVKGANYVINLSAINKCTIKITAM